MTRRFPLLALAALAFLGCNPAEPGAPEPVDPIPTDTEPRFETPGTTGEDTDPLEDIREALDQSSTALLPTVDLQATGVRTVGESLVYHRNIDDGISFQRADGYTSFVRSAPDTAMGTLIVGFPGNLAGILTEVAVNYRAQQGSGRGTVRVDLLDGTKVVATGATQRLGEPWANYAEVFTDLSIDSVSNLRAKIVLNNEATTGGVRITQLWVNVTTGTPTDAGVEPDAGMEPDSGVKPDAGSVDAGQIDAGSGDAGTPDAGDAGSVDAGPKPDAGPADAGDAGSGDAGPKPDAGPGDGGTSDAGPKPDAGDPNIPPPNLKIAFTGDTHTGNGFHSVLKLVKSEGAHILVVNGDGDYTTSASRGANWWAHVNSELPANFPVFMSVGNHDATAWSSYANPMAQRMSALGIVLDEPNLADTKFAFVYKGVSFAFVGQDGSSAYAPYISSRFQNDPHVWKICGWHKNQAFLQIGGKGNEMGYGVYEACRTAGAIISTSHEHSYERTRTLNNFTTQSVDPLCSGRNTLCVNKGRTFSFVSGLGGLDIRDQERCLPTSPPYGCNGEWAFIYAKQQAANFGALFLVLHVDGDPKKGRGYFKTITGQVVDSFTFTQ